MSGPAEDDDRTARSPADEDSVVEAFARLNVWRRGSERAPHKPLLVLLALAQLQRGEGRLLRYDEVHERLGALLRDFGPPRKVVHPEYPFWRLQRDGLWEVPQRAAALARHEKRRRTRKVSMSTPREVDLSARVLREVGAEGGFPAELAARLEADPELVNRIVAQLLERHFPPSLHEDLLDAVGMPWAPVPAARGRRDPDFRRRLLRIYQHRCAVCGYDGRLESSDLGLEAAHVRWHSHGGPDEPANGVLLCTFHHKAFDRGALGLTPDHRVLVSEHVHPDAGMTRTLLVSFHGQPLGAPLPGHDRPAPAHVKWHFREVFRQPARAG